MSELTLTDANFDTTVLPSPQPVLIDFWAPWCGPCRLMSPLVEEVAKELEGKVSVGKINVDDHPALAQCFNVLSIPTFVIFKGGKSVDQFSGSMSKQDLKKRLEKFV